MESYLPACVSFCLVTQRPGREMPIFIFLLNWFLVDTKARAGEQNELLMGKPIRAFDLNAAWQTVDVWRNADAHQRDSYPRKISVVNEDAISVDVWWVVSSWLMNYLNSLFLPFACSRQDSLAEQSRNMMNIKVSLKCALISKRLVIDALVTEKQTVRTRQTTTPNEKTVC